MKNFTFREWVDRAFKVTVLYGATLMAHPTVFLLTEIFMTSSIDGRGNAVQPEGPFLVSIITVCLVNVLLYRNMFGKGKLFKSLLLNIPVIILCMILGQMDIPFFSMYNSL